MVVKATGCYRFRRGLADAAEGEDGQDEAEDCEKASSLTAVEFGLTGALAEDETPALRL